MSKLDDDIRRLLDDEETLYDLEREEGVFRQLAGIFRGKLRWMAIAATVETIVFLGLMAWAIVAFFRTEETKWQICYATAVVLLGMLLLLIKLWGWMQMTRYALHREIKRLELRILEQRAPESP